MLGIGLRPIGGGSYNWKLGLVQISGRTGLLNGSALWAQTKNVHESGRYQSVGGGLRNWVGLNDISLAAYWPAQNVHFASQPSPVTTSCDFDQALIDLSPKTMLKNVNGAILLLPRVLNSPEES